ncbi:J domain-containing protein [Pontibacter qinzhouensis]|uniref:J domain-containing protein n=1 Tax=Pontibacter qinzhouensis TaxID=2603253 RepID=A0A5C8J0H5_9BACT|nr:J domain-containing protein [Pontibacter qinzhouensis]TXK27891.1 J domain-containing protein [Pontibacter qinzhouensis]
MTDNTPETKTQLVPQINKETSQLSKLQRQFNLKIKRINKLKSELQQRKEATAMLQARVQKELHPLLAQTVELRVKIVKQLDQAYDFPSLRKKEREKLAVFIEDLAYNLIEKYGREELIEIHDKYAPVTHAEAVMEAEEEANSMAQDLFRSVFGVEVEPDDLNDIEKMKAKLDQKMQEQEEQYANRNQKKGPKKKTKAQQEKEEAMKAEMQNISKASRRIYTELVKQLHPDKEQDEAARAWKEEVMKEVTLAYNNDDFFELLRLQMEFLQDKSKALEELPEDQLKYYVKLLDDQVHELQLESAQLTYGPEAHLYHQFGGTPKATEQKFRRQKNALREEIQELQHELNGFTDPDIVKHLIKSLKFS